MVHRRLKLTRGIRRRTKSNNYEKMMKTLLLQNQQIIIQQQNMMFMVLKQLQHLPNSSNNQITNNLAQPQGQVQPTTSPVTMTMDDTNQHTHLHQQQVQSHQIYQQQHNIDNQSHTHHPHTHHPQPQQQQQQQHHQQPSQQHLQQNNLNNIQQPQPQQRPMSQPIHSNTSSQQSSHHDQQNNIGQIALSNEQIQQVTAQLQDNSSLYLTPATSEETPMNDKTDEQELANFLENGGPLQNDLFYNPQTEIGQITPYKNHEQQETPSYYSSNNSCTESLTTPRVEQQRQAAISNINQAVVKNLSDSFKSPTKPKINIQFMSSSTNGRMKNNNAKIIQRMNISEFLRHVHSENDDLSKTTAT